jgi:hypothetical protein
VNRIQQGLAQRRLELVERSTTQRSALIDGVAPLLRKAAALERIVATMRRYSVVGGFVAGVVALVGSRKLTDIATRLLTVYMLVRRR